MSVIPIEYEFDSAKNRKYMGNIVAFVVQQRSKKEPSHYNNARDSDSLPPKAKNK